MSTDALHSLLRRQLIRHYGSLEQVPDAISGFVATIDQAYSDFDLDREMLERSIDLSSEELLQANAEMRAVLHAAPDLFLWVDGSDRILSIKGGDPSDFYLSRESLTGRRVQGLPSSELSKKFAEALQLVRDTEAMVTLEYDHALNDAHQYYEARILPLFRDQILVVIRNTSDIRAAETSRLRESKLDSIGILAGGIAHDFNNILGALRANLSLAQARLEAGDTAGFDVILSEADAAIVRATHLTGQLLTFAKGGAPVKERASVAEFITESATFALRGSKSRHHIEMAADLWHIDADPNQISQIINNLVINADQAMPEGGTVTLMAENYDADGKGVLTEGRYVKITIRDRGIGISPKHLEHIWDPYFTTKQRGSGLGLATSYSIVRRHDGLIEVESELGVGSTFSIWLPAVDPPRAVEPGSETASPASSSMRILLLDDDRSIQVVAERMLSFLGHDATITSEGDEAIEAHRLSLVEGRPYDLAILDLTVPGAKGGQETLEELRLAEPGLRAIASSGYCNDPVMSHHQDYGFNATLTKPYRLKDLSDTLARVRTQPS